MLDNKAHKQLEKRFRKFVKRDRKIENAYLLIHSDKLDVHLNFAEGSTRDMPAHPEQPYYIANIHKLLTAVIIAILEEQEKLSYEDPIATYLDKDILQNLHVIKRFSYTSEIKIKNLLNHSSGLFDFLEDKPKQGEPMLHMLLEERSEPLSKQEIIEWSKENLSAHFRPEEGYHYSETGFLLLGLIIEQITSRPYYEVLQDYIFKALKMEYSYVLQHTEPLMKNEYPLAKCYINETSMVQNNHIGLDDANGRVISTSGDLLKFMKALVNHQIIERDNLNKMADWVQFPIGIDYGYGLLRIKDTFGLMPQKYNAWGNTGLTGSFVFYHQALETYFIGS